MSASVALTVAVAATARINRHRPTIAVKLIDGVQTPVPNVADTVTILSLSGPSPKVIGELKVPVSVIGPPQSVAIAPDGSIALVTASTKLDPADPTKTAPDNRVTVVDLTTSPASILATLQAGNGPSGVSINAAGTLALVANRFDGTVSVFSIRGKTVAPAGPWTSARRRPATAMSCSPRRSDGTRHAQLRQPDFDPLDRRHARQY